MPIYEYKCESCGLTFEKLVFTSDKEDIKCPDCGDIRVERLLSSTCFMSPSDAAGCASSSPGGFS
jgi:putative FmdB family regulatory protein